MAADALDVTTVDTARTWIGARTADEDLLQVYVTAVSRLLDQHCGPVIRRTITDELHDGGHETIHLRYGPVTSISSVIELVGTTQTTCTAETFGTQPADGYLLDPNSTPTAPYSGIIRRRANGAPARWASGDSNVKVTYVAGRYAAIANIDPLFTNAAILIMKNLWRAEQSGVAAATAGYENPQALYPGFAMPRAAKQILADELRMSSFAL